MRILIVSKSKVPAHQYGGTERVIWSLGKGLAQLGHQVSYLVKQGSTCPFAEIIPINPDLKVHQQIPKSFDIVHYHFRPEQTTDLPYVTTMHGNSNEQEDLDANTIFVSKNHASRFGSESFVHNGLDWSQYPKPDLQSNRDYFHFLAKAAWRVKNVKGAIDTIKQIPKGHLKVLGGRRINFSMGFRLTLSPKVSFEGMVNDRQKANFLQHSKGLVFPVRWHEPFGLAIIESLYFGCPIFATPYGSLLELVKDDVGYLSNSSYDMAQAMLDANLFSKNHCHDYAREQFDHLSMAKNYLRKYEIVLNGSRLNIQPPRLIQKQEERFLPWVSNRKS